MKKALALILGIILIFATIPSIGAFADSDPGFSNLVMNHSFSWYTDFPFVDTNGWIYNTYLQSSTLVSNGVTSHPSPSTIVTLYQPGDYFEVSFDTDLLSSYQTPLWNVLIAYDASTSATHIEIPNDSINCYLNDELAFYEFQTYLAVDNRRWRCISFISQSSYLQETSIRFEYDGDGTPIQIPITMIMFRGYRFTPSGSLTVQEMVELQSNIVNALNTARLADLIGNFDTSDVDLSTLENTTYSILQKLASVPDIIQYIDQIETIDSNILSAINTFYSFYYAQFTDTLSAFDPLVYRTLTDNTITEVLTSSTSYKNKYIYYLIPTSLFTSRDYIHFRFTIRSYDANDIYKIDYSFGSDINNIFNYFKPIYWEYSISKYNADNRLLFDCYIPYYSTYGYDYLIVRVLNESNNNTVYGYANGYQYISYTSFNTSWYKRVELYLKQLLGINQQSLSPSVEQINNTVADQIDDITSFEDTYNQSLDTSASQIDVSSYHVTQTSGMSWMRSYTEYNFDQMQNFRILFLTPLVLALAAFFLRRKQ